MICHAVISGQTGWWDSLGQKCLACQKAIDNQVVPTYICKERESWYASYELTTKFKISNSTINKYVKEGKLKSRKIKAISGSTNFEIFLKLENKFLAEL